MEKKPSKTRLSPMGWPFRVMSLACFGLALFCGFQCQPFAPTGEFSIDANNENPETSNETQGSTTQGTPLEIAADRPLLYALRWSWEGATWDATSKAYIFTTDLGYKVGLESGYLAQLAMQLVVCEGGQEYQKQGWNAPLQRLMQWFSPRKARADHAFNDDPSVVSRTVVESFFSPPREFGTSTTSGHRYCQLHFLAGPVYQEAEDGFLMRRWSLYLKGWYQRPNDPQQHAFTASTKLMGGALVPLVTGVPLIAPAPLTTSDGTPVALQVTLERFPARGFHGLSLETLTPENLAYQFLLRLGQQTHATYQRATTP